MAEPISEAALVPTQNLSFVSRALSRRKARSLTVLEKRVLCAFVAGGDLLGVEERGDIVSHRI